MIFISIKDDIKRYWDSFEEISEEEYYNALNSFKGREKEFKNIYTYSLNTDNLVKIYYKRKGRVEDDNS